MLIKEANAELEKIQRQGIEIVLEKIKTVLRCCLFNNINF